MSNFWEYLRENSVFISCPVCNKKFNYSNHRQIWKTLDPRTKKSDAIRRLKQHQQAKNHNSITSKKIKTPKKPILIKHT